MEHPVLFLFEALGFWVIVGILIVTFILFIRQYRKVYNYELQVNRGWEDMVFRTERLLERIHELQDDIVKLKNDQIKSKEKLQEVNKVVTETQTPIVELPTKKRVKKNNNPES